MGVRVRMAVVALVAGVWPLAAVSGEGVLEINQACAVNTGCFPGDTAGFPVTISASASYGLTSDLVITDPNQRGIEINSSHVTVDLNGFLILGPTSCSGLPVTSCTPSGTGDGVFSIQGNVVVRNGTVRGMPDFGVRLGGDARIEDLHIEQNGGWGIFADVGSLFIRNRVRRNGGEGIAAGDASRVAENVITSNGGNGISTGGRLHISHNMIVGNQGDGVVATTNPGTVLFNSVLANAGTGLSLHAGSGYGQNVISQNGPPEVSGGNQIGTNVCGSNTTCP
jgi:hypothetical protein